MLGKLRTSFYLSVGSHNRPNLYFHKHCGSYMFTKIFFILTVVILDGVRYNFNLYLFAFPWNITLYIYCPLILLSLKMIVPFICPLTDLIICGLNIWYFEFFIYLVIHHLSNKYLANIFSCALRCLFCNIFFIWLGRELFVQYNPIHHFLELFPELM